MQMQQMAMQMQMQQMAMGGTAAPGQAGTPAGGGVGMPLQAGYGRGMLAGTKTVIPGTGPQAAQQGKPSGGGADPFNFVQDAMK
jgi:hypothetical protein